MKKKSLPSNLKKNGPFKYLYKYPRYKTKNRIEVEIKSNFKKCLFI